MFSQPPVPDSPLADLSHLTDSAAFAERLLLLWLKQRTADPDPPEPPELNVAVHTLWRLTAIRPRPTSRRSC